MASDWDSAPTRRLPVYFLVDTSGSMAGPKIAAVSGGLGALRREMLMNPESARAASISVITFANGAQQTPLAPVTLLTLPALTAAGPTALGAALRLLNDSLDRDLIPNTPTHKGDYKPLVFLLTDGAPTDSWEQEAQRLTTRTEGKPAAVLALAVGADADIRVLRRITPVVFATESGDVAGLDAFFQWTSASIKAASLAASSAPPGQEPQARLPQPPPGLTFAPEPEPGPAGQAPAATPPPASERDEEEVVHGITLPDKPATAPEALASEWSDIEMWMRKEDEWTGGIGASYPEAPASEQDGEEVVRGITGVTRRDPSPPTAPEQAGEEILSGWDVPTMRLPGREEAPPAASPPPPPPPPPSMPATESAAPLPSPAPMPPQAPIPDPFAQPGSPPNPWGQPPAGQPAYQPQPAPPPMYPPQPQPGYAPPPAPPQPGAGYGAPAAPPMPQMPPMAPAPQPGGYGYPGQFPAAQQGIPVTPVTVAEQVTFTAYHLKEIAPLVWEPLYVYIALDTPQAQAQVGMAAQLALAGRADQFRPARAAQASWLRRGTQLSLVPNIPGFQFNPREMIVTWEEDVQQQLFRMQAATARPGLAVNGSIQVFTGPLLRADIPISLFVRQAGMSTQMSQSFASIAVHAYRKVFASYSHKDTAVVESCETAAEVTGDRYLRDVTLLRGGEQWDPRLLQAIGEADLFQLFWSEHAAQSQAVATEWRHALSLQPGRGNFIRPVFWSKQPYAIPPELQAIHFERLSLARLGWGKARIFFHNMIGLG